jgi:hypothetical protein
MRKEYLHLCVYRCDKCAGPVVRGWTGVKENEISKETGIHAIGAVCLSCGQRQDAAGPENSTRHFVPVEWRIPPSDAVTLETETGTAKELTSSSKV